MPPKPHRPTLADVGRLAGTSTAVVSYVLNDGPRPVAPETRRRVEEAIRMLGYRRNRLAGALSGGTSNLIGLLVPDISNGFFSELCHAFEVEGRKRNLLTLLGNTGYDAKMTIEYGYAFSEFRPRGTFVTSGQTWPHEDGTLRIYLFSAPVGGRFSSVVFDEEGGSFELVKHLIGHGYEDIHLFTGEEGSQAARHREDGWRRALAQSGISTEGRWHSTSFERVAAEKIIRNILASPQRPRAVFAAIDDIALATMRAAGNLGLRVPEDLAVVGFDGIREARLHQPAITTFELPLGRLATEAFGALERAEAGVEPTMVTLSGTMCIGTSCGCEPH